MLTTGAGGGGRGREKKMTVYCGASNNRDGSDFSAAAGTRQILTCLSNRVYCLHRSHVQFHYERNKKLFCFFFKKGPIHKQLCTYCNFGLIQL